MCFRGPKKLEPGRPKIDMKKDHEYESKREGSSLKSVPLDKAALTVFDHRGCSPSLTSLEASCVTFRKGGDLSVL